ncbi:MAG: hypothetical protein NZ922_06060 [Candidatus Methanomethyliaceae archaeon]|nr:hypothetical protein [Candidatus Methanomethyliaceae archaeon]MDW7971272.1 hypothetical protein [Nitrososphaerota archaeon]
MVITVPGIAALIIPPTSDVALGIPETVEVEAVTGVKVVAEVCPDNTSTMFILNVSSFTLTSYIPYAFSLILISYLELPIVI